MAPAVAEVDERESFFSKIANDILKSAEQITARLEDGISVILTGQLAHQPDNSESSTSSSSTSHYHRDTGRINDFDVDEDDNFTEDEIKEMLRNHPLQGMADEVLGGIIQNQARPQTFMQHFEAFRSAINWQEPFIVSIVIFQCIMFIATLYVSRRNGSLVQRVVIMILVAVIVRLSEYLNRYGNDHWMDIATQNYFDSKGIFVTIMICTPLLIDSVIMLISFIREASGLLIQVKTKQLQKQFDAKKKKQHQQQQPQQRNNQKNHSTLTTTVPSSSLSPTGTKKNDKNAKKNKVNQLKKKD